MPETEEKPAPEAVADAAEQAVEEIVEDVKEAKEEAKDSAGASLSDALASAKSGLGTLKEWSGAAVSMAGGAWSTLGEWKEQGAGLARYIYIDARASHSSMACGAGEGEIQTQKINNTYDLVASFRALLYI